MLGKLIDDYRKKRTEKARENRLRRYLSGERIAWSEGYAEYKASQISQIIQDNTLLNQVKQGSLPVGFGHKLDERIVEYAWIFAHLQRAKNRFLDAGSTFNFEYLLNHPIVASKENYIYTYYPENPSFLEKRISYIYGDLRELPFKENFFQEIVCQSTIEHIDMDNSIYGYDLPPQHEIQQKSYEYLRVIQELVRVLEVHGNLYLTFPYGKFENHGFFQQFDAEMLDRIWAVLEKNGTFNTNFFKYEPNGWNGSTQSACNDAESHNPHTGKGKKDDGAAHSRAICCVHFTKK
jgi:hypothetical protein